MHIADSLAEKLLRDILDDKQVKQLLAQEQAKHLPLSDVALASGLIDEAKLAEAYAKELKVPFVSLDEPLDSRLLEPLPVGYARRFNAVVFDDQDHLKVAMANPFDQATVLFLKKLLGPDTEIYMAPEHNIHLQLSRYGYENHPEALNLVKTKPPVPGQTPKEINIAEAFEHILSVALKERAQSIHIEPRENLSLIRMRIDGVLQTGFKLSRNTAGLLIDYIRQEAGLDTRDNRSPQDGIIQMAHGTSKTSLRISILPVLDGIKVTINLLHGNLAVPSLEYLGFWGHSLKQIHDVLRQPHGLVIVGNPAGSDAQVTLCSMLSLVRSSGLSISSVEHQLAFRLDRVNQLELNPATGLDIHKALSVAAKQDSDILMVDDLPSSRSIQQATTASQQHLVLAAVRAHSPEQTIKRLTANDIPPANLRLHIFQKRVRRLCPDCRQKFTPATKLKSLIIKQVASLWSLAVEASVTIPGSIELQNSPKASEVLWQASGLGCETCHYTGYRGWINIIQTDKSSISLAEDALIKSLCGLISVEIALES